MITSTYPYKSVTINHFQIKIIISVGEFVFNVPPTAKVI